MTDQHVTTIRLSRELWLRFRRAQEADKENFRSIQQVAIRGLERELATAGEGEGE